ncbi:MAG: ATP-dependent DNA helicase RecG [Wenzhouxiangellaceae bacterium]
MAGRLSTTETRAADSIATTALRGVGPRQAEALSALGLNHLGDLLFHLPRAYQNRTQLTPVGALRAGMTAVVEGEIVQSSVIRRHKPMLVAALGDGTGHVGLRFFHLFRNQAQVFAPGTRMRCFGEARATPNGLELIHPSYQRIQADQSPPLPDHLTALYPCGQGVRHGDLARYIQLCVDWLQAGQIDVADLIPAALHDTSGLPNLRQALITLHRPPADVAIDQLLAGQHPASQRLIVEELTAHYLAIRQMNQRRRQQTAPALPPGDLGQRLLEQLPFSLTGAQQRVSSEVSATLNQPHPSLRLVQGDVGSGKTVIAALAACQAAANQYQTALLAPTELLAEQHASTLRQWLEPLDLRVVWLSGTVKGKARTAALRDIADGAAVVVGTHALIQSSVEFARLGLVIIDEQHRFGVGQRLALRDKGDDNSGHPHQLMLTATPIPRTLSMTLYAGIQISSIDERPPGRQPIKTVVIDSQRRDQVIQRVALACRQGRQAYWVCTLVEDNEEIPAQAAENTFTELQQQLSDLNVGLVHGKMKPADKERQMSAFRDGQIQLLVATTVIEVGVDVPNASLMIIDNAERLGLAQLHQLRGRVGRGDAASSCVLLYRQPLSHTARSRLDTLRQTDDGFAIAEMDLQLRGPGELLGQRQTGLVQLRVADLTRDRELLPAAESLGERLLQSHPEAAAALIERWLGGNVEYAET